MKTYTIKEIFYSIQGEGSYAGSPMVFVRFSGCNLQCHFCDTDFQGGDKMTGPEIAEAILQRIQARTKHSDHPIPVCFTGGEPLLQLDKALVNTVKNMRKKVTTPVHLETNGTLTPPVWQEFRCITVSPKIVAAGNLGGLLRAPTAELKVVWDPSDQALLDNHLHAWSEFKWRRQFIQPCTKPDGSTNVQEVIDYIIKNPQWDLSVQMHKVIKVE